ncbi:hypothetical protein VB712_06415 [Spirulina sp. CCNP1310]|uniref:hypothetical protein n=1 Tax=Spirulina sp. CCNP1310 TaxID=3110249 RepID=UPI002B206D60|nr:hypothetical protein [Spirulina sp. CCNP1310]MEA5418855.1 hypothetical protein [Spirulina sp. CCNP1310]
MIPKKARQRHPDDPVVATFMLPYAQWQAFKTIVESQGETVSATLLAFIEGYLAAMQSPQGAAAVIDARIDDLLARKLEPWQEEAIAHYQRLAQIETQMAQVEIHVETLKRRSEARLIDIEVEPVETTHHHTTPLSEIELCRQFGINPYSLGHNADLRRLSIPEYLHELTGWYYHAGHYHPPEGF